MVKTMTPFDYFYADKVSVSGTLRSTNWSGLRKQIELILCDIPDERHGRTISDEKFHILMDYLWVE
jgi:hypothetical protein